MIEEGEKRCTANKANTLRWCGSRRQKKMNKNEKNQHTVDRWVHG